VWLLWGALSPSDVFAVDSCSLQIQHRLPYLLLFEDDIIVNATALFRFVEQACAHFEASEASIMQLDTYAEALLISLDGAKLITHRVREVGICKNDDQVSTALPSTARAPFAPMCAVGLVVGAPRPLAQKSRSSHMHRYNTGTTMRYIPPVDTNTIASAYSLAVCSNFSTGASWACRSPSTRSSIIGRRMSRGRGILAGQRTPNLDIFTEPAASLGQRWRSCG